MHAQAGTFDGAVPVDAIARALDIGEVRRAALDGCEGVLLTDAVRSRGAILVNDRRGERRARFSIAHELGHFLLERHQLHGAAGFHCRAGDLHETRADTRHRRQESEANAFAAALLVPGYRLQPALQGDPDLRTLIPLRIDLDVSLEVLVRHYLDVCRTPLAAVWSADGRVRYVVRNRRFPFISRTRGERLSEATPTGRVVGSGRKGVTTWLEGDALYWCDRPDRALREQCRLGANGHAVTLLWMDDPEGAPDAGGVAELGMPDFRRSGR